MTPEEKIKGEIFAKFPGLEQQVLIKRERRISLFLEDQAIFKELFDFLVRQLRFSGLTAITGIDNRDSFAVIYHLVYDGKIILDLKVRVSRDNPAVSTATAYFPSADIYERELMDLFGIKVDGLAKGARYPLPDGWPEGQHPLRKDWRQDA